MLQPALADQDPQRGPDSRIGRRLGHLRADLRGRGLSEPVDDVHALALAPAQTRLGRVLVPLAHGAVVSWQVCKKQQAVEKAAQDTSPTTGRSRTRARTKGIVRHGYMKSRHASRLRLLCRTCNRTFC